MSHAPLAAMQMTKNAAARWIIGRASGDDDAAYAISGMDGKRKMRGLAGEVGTGGKRRAQEAAREALNYEVLSVKENRLSA